MAYGARYLGPRWSIRGLVVVSAISLVLSCSSAWASARAERRASAPQRTSVQANVPQGPLDFRCDKLEILSKPQHRQICRGHVLVRRDDMFLCCNTLTGESDAEWSLTQLVCSGDVRLRRGDQTIWAESGQYDVATGEIVLSGAPLLDKAGSRVSGEQMTLRLGEEHARIVRPRGQVLAASTSAEAPVVAKTGGPLPSLCPIGPKPARRD